jgi:hypothetical protein
MEEKTNIDSTKLISIIEVKHKPRNNSDFKSSVTGNGGDEHWSRDRA